MSGFTSRLSLTHIYASKYNDKALKVNGTAQLVFKWLKLSSPSKKSTLSLKSPEIDPESCYPSDCC